MRLRKLRLELLLAVLVIAASLPVTLLTFGLLLRSWDEQIGLAERQNVKTARAVSIALDQEIESAIAALNVLANLDVFDDWQLPRFRDAALRLLGQRPGWLGLVLADASGRVLINTAYPSAAGGNAVQSWARAVAETRRASVSELFEDPATRQHFVVVGVPVTRNAVLQFVLAAHLDASALAHLLDRQSLPADGVITLIDASKRVIARTRPEPGLIGKPAGAAFTDAANRMQEGTWEETLPDGQSAYAGLSRSALTGWTVGISQPRAAIDAPIRRAFWMLAAVGVLVLAIAMAIALILSRALIRSLAAATVATQALVRGRPMTPQASALAELEELWQGLRDAQTMLEQRLRERDQADRERTRALEAERLAREASEKDQIRLAVTLSSIADGVVATDQAGNVTLLNEVAQALTGWPEDEAHGRPIDEVLRLVDEDKRESAENPVARVYREGRTMELGRRVALIARDGREIPVEDSGAPIVTADGRLLGVVLVFRDATRMREAERMREQLLAREQAARHDAETLNQSKDQFVALVSHELRAPLNAIYGWVQLLQGGKLDPAQQQRALEVIERSTRAQTQLIDDLLDMSRVLRGSLRLELSNVDLSAAVQTAVDSVRPAANAKALALGLATHPGLQVSADPDRVQQVLGNILGNAIKFTPQGGRIDVELNREGDDAIIRICDSGVGIPADVLPHIFQPFRQGDGTASTRSHSGLGIGLALVRYLVEKHGGSVSAHSDGQDRGAVFTIRLPVRAQSRAARNAPASEAA
ncbi:MAG: PAS domain S-box protein [Burkholderiales bacterium]|nr:PAS domain S-box protein [Burkholderiales bacterium]